MKVEHSLRNKVLLVVVLNTFIVLTAAGLVVLAYDLREYRESRTNDFGTQIELLSYTTVPALEFEDQAVATENLQVLELRPGVRAAAIYTARGARFASYERAGEQYVFPELPEQEGVVISGTQLEVFTRIVANGQILGTAYIAGDYLVWDRVLSFLRINGMVALGGMALSAVLGWWLQSLITRPILSVAAVARDVVENRDYDKRAVKLSSDEVGRLVDAFNGMLDEIQLRTSSLEESNRELEEETRENKEARETIERLNAELEEKVAVRTRQLQVTNQELESFCYSVSHDLRGPLRSISGFSQALVEELPGDLGPDVRRYLDKITAATHRMGQLIEDLLNLSRVSRGELRRTQVNVTDIALEVVQELAARDPGHEVDAMVWNGMTAEADPKLLRIALENLLGNAWKFSAGKPDPKVTVGVMRERDRAVFFVRDNGAGFDMRYADKLFGAFQRLHGMNEFPGTGIGLATVQRIIHRHGGSIWFDATPQHGAVFFFTLAHDARQAVEGSDKASIDWPAGT